MSSNRHYRLGLLDVILIVNIILKIANLVTWSWTFVLWPLWVTILVLFILHITLD